MPVCKQCQETFPFLVMIAGKQRNLGSRRYCLKCSPFGQHNTRKLHAGPATRFCPNCGKSTTGGRRSWCPSCLVVRNRRALKLRAVEYKGGKCKRCNFKEFITALQFHHTDPSEKDFVISSSTGWGRIREELNKCVLLCANCHAGLHAGEWLLSEI